MTNRDYVTEYYRTIANLNADLKKNKKGNYGVWQGNRHSCNLCTRFKS